MGVFKRKVRGQRLKTFSAKFTFRGRLHQRHGLPDRDTAHHWMATTRLALQRGEVGFIKARRAADVQPLIEEYVTSLESNGRAADYCRIVRSRLLRLARDIPWMTSGDLAAESFDAWRASKPKSRGKVVAAKTLNQYLDHAQQFADWLWKVKKILPANPFAGIARKSALPNNGYRRAATLDELNKLIAAAPERRKDVYLFLIYVPLRRRALAGLCYRDLDLVSDRPTLTLPAKLNKGKRDHKLALRVDVVARLLKRKGDAGPDDRVFEVIPRVRELQDDLAAAGLKFDDGKGSRRFDLHAFRRTAIRLLKQNGVSLDEAHVFLGHRDRRTTERYYDDDQVDAGIMAAAEKMPAMAIFGVGAQVGAQNAATSGGTK